MIYTDLLFESNKCFGLAKASIENGAIVFKCDSVLFDWSLLRSIFRFINTIKAKRYPPGIPVRFLFNRTILFSDKLTYVLFECICYQLTQENHPVYVSLNPQNSITTHGYRSSPLWLLSTNKAASRDKFPEKFHHDLYSRHFRRVLLNNAQEDKLSKLMDDIAIFQKPFNIKENDREKIAEVLVELVGNAKEHSSGDCLIDFDISEKYIKRGEDRKNYHGINIAILNFSPELLGTSLKRKLCNGDNLSGRYDLVRQAYTCHQTYFDTQYMQEDFYNIATFQHKISGRDGNVSTGGTGLTKLIRSLEESSDAYSCYVVSGQRKLEFKKEYMVYNEDYWIGFNRSNDFLHRPPDQKLLTQTPIIFPGTAYNLNFVMEVS